MEAEGTVVVTRPEGQEGFMMAALEMAGYSPAHYPALAIEPLTLERARQRLIMDLDQYHAVIFVSANAVHLGLEALAEYWPQWPVGLHWVAVGAATAQALRAANLPAEAPASGFNSEAVLELPCLQALSERRVLLLRGEGGRGVLEDTLAERGARVDAIPVYRRICDDTGQWPETSVLAVLVTSVESWHCLREQGLARFNDALVVAGSERIAEAVRADGAPQVVAAASPRDEDMLECLITHRNPQ